VRVAVTGGSGVVGAAVVRHLVAEGHDVSALARSTTASANLVRLGASVISGDVFDRPALARLVEGRLRVFHVAGVNEMCSPDPSFMWKVNVDGALAVLETAIEGGVERFVHTSSAATIGEEKGAVGTERSKHRGYFLSEYERSKTVAERLVLDRAREIEVVSVNPSSVQGPGRATGTGALLLAAAQGRLPFVVDTTISLVDIDDCARGHLLAAEHGQPGERYLISGATLTIRELFRVLRHHTSRLRRPWFLRPQAVTAMAPVVEIAMRSIGRQSPLCQESAQTLVHGHRYDGSRATEQLGLVYTSIEDTLRRTLDWFHAGARAAEDSTI
jgi:dihydroflavonol-4-reductase